MNCTSPIIYDNSILPRDLCFIISKYSQFCQVNTSTVPIRTHFNFWDIKHDILPFDLRYDVIKEFYKLKRSPDKLINILNNSEILFSAKDYHDMDIYQYITAIYKGLYYKLEIDVYSDWEEMKVYHKCKITVMKELRE